MLGMNQSPAKQNASFRAVIARNGGPASLGRMIGVAPNTVKAWNRLDSIPAAHWQALVSANAADLDELADAAARKMAA